MNIKNLPINKKTAVILVAAILLTEIIWAVKTLNLMSVITPAKPSPQIPAVYKSKPKGSIALQAPKREFKVGEKIIVAINISSLLPTDGADVILKYDPGILTVVSDGKTPVVTGNLYPSFPLNRLDSKNGQVNISGISADKAITPQGVMGWVSFTAVKSGSTIIGIDFTPGSTIDSNITESNTGKDILEEAANLSLTVLP